MCICEANTYKKANVVKLDSDLVVNAAKFLVKYINEIILKEYSNLCTKLEFLKIKDAKIMGKTDSKYSIIFETSPNNAIFDGLVTLKNKSDERNFELLGTISRINMYGNTSRCLENHFLKNYCYCKLN